MVYADELGDGAVITFTHQPPDGWTGHRGRVDSAPIAEPGVHGGRGNQSRTERFGAYRLSDAV